MEALRFLAQALGVSTLQLTSFLILMCSGTLISKLNLNFGNNTGMANINDLDCLLK